MGISVQPCCCGVPSTCIYCDPDPNVTGGTAPTQIAVTLSLFSQGTGSCAACSAANGTYILDRAVCDPAFTLGGGINGCCYKYDVSLCCGGITTIWAWITFAFGGTRLECFIAPYFATDQPITHCLSFDTGAVNLATSDNSMGGRCAVTVKRARLVAIP